MKWHLLLLVTICVFVNKHVAAQKLGTLYSMTSSSSPFSGTLFSYNPPKTQDSINLYFKGSNGTDPQGDLLQASNGLLYGLALNGGSFSNGVLFSYNSINGDDTILVNFNNTATGEFPYGSLIQASNGLLYGMTSQGGTFGYGTLFSYNITTSTFNVLINFDGTHGATPYGSLIQASDSLLYGMTYKGGSSNTGVIFSYNIVNGKDSLLLSFTGANGSGPAGSLIQAYDGLLYGMTIFGGTHGLGTLFSFNTKNGFDTVIINFSGTDGEYPAGSLIQARDSLFYGLAYLGGTSADGTLFRFNSSSKEDTVLMNFNGANGNEPNGSLIQATDGLLYGMTSKGGTNSTGTIFSYNINAKNSSLLLSFTGTNGLSPFGDLLEVMTASLQITNNVCFGDSAGSAIINVSGGHYPLTYIWSNGATSDTIKGLKSGNYTGTVIDSKGITYNFNFTIKQPPQLLDSIIKQVNVLCYGGNNGSVSIAAKGGTEPYNYTWSSSLSTSTSVDSLVAGTYTCIVNDKNSCSTPIIVAITQPARLKDSIISSNNVTCNGLSNGSVSVGVKGGTPPYTYSWSSGAGTNALANNIIAGTYTCVIKDSNLCIVSDTVTIVQPAKISTITSYTSTPCAKSFGEANVNVSGGTPPYAYSWSNACTNALDTALLAGTYTCTITDSFSCKQVVMVSIPNIDGPSDSVVHIQNVSCYGDSNGSAIVTITGGAQPYTYNWSPMGGNNPVVSGLAPGTYTFTATDSKGCVGFATVLITQPAALRDSIAMLQNVSCSGGNNGIAEVGVKGGTAPYTYSWSTLGGSTALVSDLFAGSYTCAIADTNNCPAKQVVIVITSPAPISIITSSTVTKCGSSTGTANVIVSGGVKPYTYLWSPGGATSASVTNMAGGTYYCTVSDSFKCISTATVLVVDTGGPKEVIMPNSFISCYGDKTGSAIANVTNGVSPYTYQWSSGAGTNSFAINLSAGSYICTVTDASGCTTNASITIMQPPELIVESSTIGVCYGLLSGGSASVAPSGGTSPYNYSWSNGSTTDSINNVGPGSYACTVTDFNGCSTTVLPNIGVASKMKIDTFIVHLASCNDCSDGSIEVYVSGGVPAGDSTKYYYLWNTIPVQTTSIATGLDTGAYCVNITSYYCDETLPCDTSVVVAGLSSISNYVNGVRIYPVPSDGPISIELPALGQTVLSVSDELGNIVYTEQVDADYRNYIAQLNLSSLPGGIYIVKITSARGISVKKIVLQK
jgi:uncharacterized repeat protein (TIGR03803 family)